MATKPRTKRERQELAGIPDSRPPIAAETAEDPSPLLGLHVGGMKVADMVVMMGAVAGVDWLSKLAYHHTDEAIAERNEGKQTRRVEITKDELSKKIEERRDTMASDEGAAMEAWEIPNPMTEVANPYKRPGFVQRFLDPKTCDDNGLRGWQPILNDKGGKVELGKLFLAEMPEAKARTRAAHYRAIGEAKAKAVKEEFNERLAESGLEPLDR